MGEWLTRPASLFDIQHRRAIVVGASGAFGSLAAKTLAAAGANITLSAAKRTELESLARQCRQLGAEVEIVGLRSNTENDANAIVRAAVSRFGGVDILVVAS